MNKAFTKETDDDGGDGVSPATALPPGSKNYITPSGAKRLQEELRRLLHEERPQVTKQVSWAASNGDRSENADYQYGKRRLRQIDSRIHFLSKRLESVEVVDPTSIVSQSVKFGATVTINDHEGTERVYAIVGADESDAASGKISWLSPIARAMINAKAGDLVTFKAPNGDREIEIVKVEYVEIR